MPRFVILHHETPPGYERPTHWDFMLERGGVLWTWSLPQEPSPGRTLLATRLADHRLAYLEYEGEVAGGRGRVTRWDQGVYETLSPLSPAEMRYSLAGQKITGEINLTRTEATDQWLFLWKGN